MVCQPSARASVSVGAGCDFFGGGGFSSGRFCSRDRFQLVLGIGAVMERAHCKQNYDHKGDGCQNDGNEASGFGAIAPSAATYRSPLFIQASTLLSPASDTSHALLGAFCSELWMVRVFTSLRTY